MIVLFLDDNGDRHTKFRDRTKVDAIDHAYTAVQAIRFLDAMAKRGERYDIAYLDHDLGGPVGEDGRMVARHIATMPADVRPRTVVIHSWNMPAADQMAAILALVVPVVWQHPFQEEWPGDGEASE